MPIVRSLVLALVLAQFPPPAVDVPKRTAPPWLDPYRENAGRLRETAVPAAKAILFRRTSFWRR